MSDRRAILVIGAGDATGGAIARRFAREGYIACVTRRTADRLQPLVEQIRADGGEAHAFGSDARQEDAMVSLVETIERDIAPIDVAVFNIGANVRFGITETTARVYQKVWEMACFSGFLMGREYATVTAARHMSYADARAFRKRFGLSVFMVGLACSLVPFVAPLVGASAMTRLVQSLR